MKSNNTYKTSQIIDMLDCITERIDDIEKLLKHQKISFERKFAWYIIIENEMGENI